MVSDSDVEVLMMGYHANVFRRGESDYACSGKSWQVT